MATIKMNALWDFQGYGRMYRERFIAKYEISQLYSPVSLILSMRNKWCKIRSNDANIINMVKIASILLQKFLFLFSFYLSPVILFIFIHLFYNLSHLVYFQLYFIYIEILFTFI